MTVITPEESAEQTAILLLHLADEKGINPHEVKVITDNGLEFDVPDELAEAYLEALGGVEEASADESGEDTEAEEAPAPKRRGRPPKNPTE
jgi:hypothetical protein